jgi:geranylgeranyl pyrophosphate synthase
MYSLNIYILNNLRFYSTSSSLLANSARAALLLVKHSSKQQEIAWMFGKNLAIAHKIWSELMDFRKDKTLKEDTILNAVYKDNCASLEAPTQSNKEVNNSLENIRSECENLFATHYSLAMDNLKSLESEDSQQDALTSLRSILYLMKKTIQTSIEF